MNKPTKSRAKKALIVSTDNVVDVLAALEKSREAKNQSSR